MGEALKRREDERQGFEESESVRFLHVRVT